MRNQGKVAAAGRCPSILAPDFGSNFIKLQQPCELTPLALLYKHWYKCLDISNETRLPARLKSSFPSPNSHDFNPTNSSIATSSRSTLYPPTSTLRQNATHRRHSANLPRGSLHHRRKNTPNPHQKPSKTIPRSAPLLLFIS
jgi:hypothetical protein